MKKIASGLTSLVALGVLAMDSGASMQLYDDTQACTLYDSVLNWNMVADRDSILNRTGAPFDAAEILDLRPLVFGDQSTPEVFGLVRQPASLEGISGALPKGKRGGYSRLTWWSSGAYKVYFDRGPSTVGGSALSDNFYTTPNATTGFIGTDGGGERNFKTNTGGKKRASMKIDYLCSTPTVPGYTIWKPLGAWNMLAQKTRTLSAPNSEYSVSTGRIIDLSASIVSDPDEYGSVKVDNFEHVSTEHPLGSGRGRGGILWIGYGCYYGTGGQGDCGVSGTGHSSMLLRLYAGYAGGPGADYRGSSGFTSTSSNRGWIKIQYTGPKSSTKVPYAMKTRVIASGAWDMTTDRYLDIPFSELRVNARRVANISTVIHSDPGETESGGTTVSNFHRTMIGTTTADLGGGVTYVDEASGPVLRLAMTGKPNNGGFGYNFYNNSAYNSGDYTRAHVSVDYLAGSCAQGPPDLEVDAIPSGPKRTGDCAGSAEPFLLQGAGDSFGNALYDGADQDAFTLFSRSVVNDGTKTLAVKVESVSGTGGVAGLTLRTSDLKKNSPHATVIVDGGGYVQFLTRSATGNSNVQQGTYSSSLPVWLGLRQSGSTLTAYISTASSPDVSQMATTWTQVGNSASLSALLNPESVRVGMVVSNDDYYGDISNAQMRSFTEQN